MSNDITTNMYYASNYETEVEAVEEETKESFEADPVETDAVEEVEAVPVVYESLRKMAQELYIYNSTFRLCRANVTKETVLTVLKLVTGLEAENPVTQLHMKMFKSSFGEMHEWWHHARSLCRKNSDGTIELVSWYRLCNRACAVQALEQLEPDVESRPKLFILRPGREDDDRHAFSITVMKPEEGESSSVKVFRENEHRMYSAYEIDGESNLSTTIPSIALFVAERLGNERLAEQILSDLQSWD